MRALDASPTYRVTSRHQTCQTSVELFDQAVLSKKGLDVLEKIPKSSAHDTIRVQLKEFIMRAELRPGDKLPSESELAHRLQVSRAAIRESLRSLEAVGIIRVEHGRGRYLRQLDMSAITDTLAYALVLDVRSLEDLLAVRRVLEVGFLQYAVARLTDEDLTALRSIVQAMTTSTAEGRPIAADDMSFHRTLYRKTNNDVLMKILDAFWDLFFHLRDRGALAPGPNEETASFHAQILSAIEAADIGTAKEVLAAHFDDVGEQLAHINSPVAKERAAD